MTNLKDIAKLAEDFKAKMLRLGADEYDDDAPDTDREPPPWERDAPDTERDVPTAIPAFEEEAPETTRDFPLNLPDAQMISDILTKMVSELEHKAMAQYSGDEEMKDTALKNAMDVMELRDRFKEAYNLS